MKTFVRGVRYIYSANDPLTLLLIPSVVNKEHFSLEAIVY
jgi:hypothetical protein